MARPRKTPRTFASLPEPAPLTPGEVLDSQGQAPGCQVFLSQAEEYLRIDIRLDRQALSELTRPVLLATPDEWLGMVVLFGMLYGPKPMVVGSEEQALLNRILFTRTGAKRVTKFLQNTLSADERGESATALPGATTAADPTTRVKTDHATVIGNAAAQLPTPVVGANSQEAVAEPDAQPARAKAVSDEAAERERRRQLFRERARQNNLI